MLTKKCFKCGLEKPLSEYYKHFAMGDGHLNKCKECTKKDVSMHRANNVDVIRQYDRARSKLPHRKAKAAKVFEEWKSKHPDRRKAQQAVNNAIRDGKLAKLPCFVCGEKAEAHHPDYSSPLDVVWLCPPHHKQAHAIAR